MFTQSCFVKRNTPELRQYLKKIGYKYGGKASSFEQSYLYCYYDKYFECNSFPARYHGIIDCGTNEDLFLALAALNNYTDKYQWFVGEHSNTWYYCEDDYCPKKFLSNERWHKANTNEIIERFNHT